MHRIPKNIAPYIVAAAMVFVCPRAALAQLILGFEEKLPPNINAPDLINHGPELSADGLTMYYQIGLNYSFTPLADLYVTTRDSLDGPWSDPRPLGSPINTTAYVEGGPALSPDGRELYFDDGAREESGVPFRPGGLGGPDLWVSRWDNDNGAWGVPQNLGEPVNSPYRDHAANLSADGLELYFSSDRPGGSGLSDIWVARRTAVDQPWSTPMNVGPSINSNYYDEMPALSPGRRILFFASSRPGGVGDKANLWFATRDSPSAEWGTPLPFNRVNGSHWTILPEFAYDGNTLYFSRVDSPNHYIYQLPLRPAEALPIAVGSEYRQDFDEALGDDGLDLTVPLPDGWTGSNNTVLAFDTVTQPFHHRLQSPTAGSIFNAGFGREADRSLATGVSAGSEGDQLQFLAQIKNGEATHLRLEFAIEAWGAGRVSSSSPPGEAAFHLLVEVDSGGGFDELLDLGTVTTGPNLVVPPDRIINGNDPAFRTEYDSGWLDVVLQEDSLLRLRWITDTEAATAGWTFGLDDMVLSLSALLSGDYNGNGRVEQADLDLVLLNWGANASLVPATWVNDLPIGAIDQAELDGVLLNWGNTSAVTMAGVPEPDGMVLALLALTMVVMFSNQSAHRRHQSGTQ